MSFKLLKMLLQATKEELMAEIILQKPLVLVD